MTARVLAAAALASAAVAVATLPPGAGAAVRLRGLARPQARSAARPQNRTAAGPAGAGARAGGLRLVAVALVAAGVLATVPSLPGLALAAAAAGLAVAVLPPLVPPQRPPAPVLAGDLPPVLDLLAACLAAGAPLRDALAVVGEAAPPPLGPLLRAAAAALALGSAPETALACLRSHPHLERAADVLVRAEATGTAPADQLVAISSDARAAARESARAAARRAGVLVVLPLGLCFLPAFVLLGVVPVVAGVARQVLP